MNSDLEKKRQSGRDGIYFCEYLLRNMVAGSSSALTRYAKRIYNEPARGVHDCAPWGKICFFFRFDTITEKQENGRGFFLFSLAFHYHPPPEKKL